MFLPTRLCVDSSGGAMLTSRAIQGGAHMESQIRYLAIVSEHPEVLASFLLPLFRHARARPLRQRRCRAHRRVLQHLDSQAARRRTELGISHFGITIDDIGDSRSAPARDSRPTRKSARTRRPLSWRLSASPIPAAKLVALSTSSVPHAGRRARLSVHSPSRGVCPEQ